MSDGSLLLSQSKYIRDLISKVNMDFTKGMPTHMVSSLKLYRGRIVPIENPSMSRSIVGALEYALLTRPKISFSVNKACQFLSNLSEEH